MGSYMEGPMAKKELIKIRAATTKVTISILAKDADGNTLLDVETSSIDEAGEIPHPDGVREGYAHLLKNLEEKMVILIPEATPGKTVH